MSLARVGLQEVLSVVGVHVERRVTPEEAAVLLEDFRRCWRYLWRCHQGHDLETTEAGRRAYTILNQILGRHNVSKTLHFCMARKGGGRGNIGWERTKKKHKKNIKKTTHFSQVKLLVK